MGGSKFNVWMASALAAGVLVSACAPMGPPRDRMLVWADEFDGEMLDTRCWNRVVESPPWDPQQYVGYVDGSRNLYLRDGLLWIDAYREDVVIDGRQSRYTAAQITTVDRAVWLYGYIEARMRVPPQAGAFPAFWMMPQYDAFGHWPASGEIDIMEHLGREPEVVHTTVHYGDREGRHARQGRATRADVPYSDDFHVYALEWRPGLLRWFVDGRMVFQTWRWPSPDSAHPHAPFDQPFYLLLNLAVGGQWAHEPPETTEYPMQLVVDYVRVYDLTRVPPPDQPLLDATSCPAGGPSGVTSPGLAQTASADR